MKPHKTRESVACCELFCLIILASDLSQISAKSERAIGQNPVSNLRTSVSVSTSVVSSMLLRPPVAQIVARSLVDGDAMQPPLPNQIDSNRSQHQALSASPMGKIQHLSQLAPIDISRLRYQEERRRRQQQEQEQLLQQVSRSQRGEPQYQLLQPRLTAAEVSQPHEAEVALGPTSEQEPQKQQQQQPQSHVTRAESSHNNDAVTSEVQARQVSQEPRDRGALRAILRGAKKLLSGGLASIEQRAGGILWLGTNVLAALIPIASLLGLPSFASASANSTTSDETKRNSLTGRLVSSLAKLAGGQQLIAALATSGTHGLQGRVEYVMGWLERSVEHLPNFPRLHPQECVKRSICEAHHEPNRYGAVGLTLRMLFPASSNNGSETETDNMEYKVINKYRHAAGYGLNRRLESNGSSAGQPVCKEKYDDCLISLLEVGQKLFDYFLS